MDIFFDILERLVENKVATPQVRNRAEPNTKSKETGTPAPIHRLSPTSTKKLISTLELKENDKECRSLLLREWECVHDAFHVENPESLALKRGGTRGTVGESAERAVLPVRHSHQLSLLFLLKLDVDGCRGTLSLDWRCQRIGHCTHG